MFSPFYGGQNIKCTFCSHDLTYASFYHPDKKNEYDIDSSIRWCEALRCLLSTPKCTTHQQHLSATRAWERYEETIILSQQRPWDRRSPCGPKRPLEMAYACLFQSRGVLQTWPVKPSAKKKRSRACFQKRLLSSAAFLVLVSCSLPTAVSAAVHRPSSYLGCAPTSRVCLGFSK